MKGRYRDSPTKMLIVVAAMGCAFAFLFSDCARCQMVEAPVYPGVWK